MDIGDSYNAIVSFYKRPNNVWVCGNGKVIFKGSYPTEKIETITTYINTLRIDLWIIVLHFNWTTIS
jgi:hypothetical protein